jgi:class 3 adenylate cyclase
MTTVVFTDLAVRTSLCEQLGDKTESGVVTQIVRVLQGDFEQHHGRVAKQELGAEGEALSLHSKSSTLTIGHATDAGLPLNDPRMPLLHATLE